MPRAASATPSLVIPCFNEALRFEQKFVAELLAAHATLNVLLVDAGSSDATWSVLRAAADALGSRVQCVQQNQNLGKGEAVRFGMRKLCERKPAEKGPVTIVGFADADFATPPRELLRLLRILEEQQGLRATLGSRVPRLGAHLHRTVERHLLSRIFATGASLVLGTLVYDTQCGAKFFRVDDAFRAAIAEPFSSRWVFDVELLGRLLGRFANTATYSWTRDQLLEVPLDAWSEVAGSKLNRMGMFEAAKDLLMFARRRNRSPIASPAVHEKNESEQPHA